MKQTAGSEIAVKPEVDSLNFKISSAAETQQPSEKYMRFARKKKRSY